MVTGLDVFRGHFREYSNRYLLIGGTACDLLMSDAGLPFRATKDLDIVLCVDAATGKTVWKQFFPDVADNPNGRHPLSGGPMFSFGKPKQGPHNLPAVAGGKVAAIGFGGHLYCLDAATGAVVWQKRAFEGPHTMSSVLPAAGNFLCLHSADIPDGNKKRLGFTAFKAEDGSIAWTTPLVETGRTGPIRHLAADREVILIGGRCLDAASGKQLWEVPGHGPHGSPAIGEGFLMLAGPARDGGPLGYRLGSDIATAPTPAWRLGAEHAVSNSCSIAIHRGFAYYKGVNPSDTNLSRMVAVELATGKATATEPFRNDACGACSAGDGMIFYEDGAWSAMPAFAKLPGHIGTPGDGALDYADCHSPCYVEGRLYVRGRNHLRCYDLRAP